MSLVVIPPWFWLLGAAGLTLVLPATFRRLLLIAAPALALAHITLLPEGPLGTLAFLDYELTPLYVDSLSWLFAFIFALITVLTGIYSYAIAARGTQVAKLLYAAGALGVTFAADYFTLYVFWELMALASFYLIAVQPEVRSRQAALRYLFVHLFGGVLLLGGILWNAAQTDSIAVATIASGSGGPAAILILLGFALNAAAVPLHAWLPDSYPRATLSGAVLLSALTTKTAVYVLARVFPGWEILVVAGIVMALYGVIFAFLADDIREILAYHIISQVGYMVAGVGLGTPLAIAGATAHAFCHILYKALLFMGAGAVIQATGAQRLSSLGGLFRSQPGVFILYMVGAVSISGFPFFNGFISKSMVVAGYEAAGSFIGMLLLEAAAVGTFLSVGLKLPYFTWFGTGRLPAPPAALPKTMYLGMGLTALLCFLLGIRPDLLYAHLPFPSDYQPYTASHLLTTAQLLTFTALVFWLVKGRLKIAPSLTLDLDWLYRRPARLYARLFVEGTGRFFDGSERIAQRITRALVRFIQNPPAALESLLQRRTIPSTPFDPERQRRPLAWTTGAILLTFVLIGLWTL